MRSRSGASPRSGERPDIGPRAPTIARSDRGPRVLLRLHDHLGLDRVGDEATVMGALLKLPQFLGAGRPRAAEADLGAGSPSSWPNFRTGPSPRRRPPDPGSCPPRTAPWRRGPGRSAAGSWRGWPRTPPRDRRTGRCPDNRGGRGPDREAAIEGPVVVPVVRLGGELGGLPLPRDRDRVLGHGISPR